MTLLLFSLLHSFIAQAAPIPHEPSAVRIPRTEIDEYLQKHPDVERAEAMDRLVLYRLAVSEAKRKGWDQDPATTREIDKAIYASYLRHVRDAAAPQLDPSNDEVQRAYQQEPLVRVRVLTLRGNETAKLNKIRAQWKAGTPFQKLVLQYSQDDMRQVGGDLDFRGPQNLPAPIYAAARQLKKNEVSGVIQTTQAVHLVQLMDTRPFAEAGPTYLSWLRGRLRSEREKALLSASLSGLKKDAVVEVIP